MLLIKRKASEQLLAALTPPNVAGWIHFIPFRTHSSDFKTGTGKHFRPQALQSNNSHGAGPALVFLTPPLRAKRMASNLEPNQSRANFYVVIITVHIFQSTAHMVFPIILVS